ncbi:MAG: aldolase/citrate lyase family protein [Candidatus Bipolaricaulota bacterium]|nr:aldolase/citrate lyase family protein [Candidatus Bipolaricaulota bacterium]
MSEICTAGTEAKRDCQVTVTRAKSIEIKIDTTNRNLLVAGIRAVVEETVAALGVKGARVDVVDSGALDYVVSARVEAALRMAIHELEVEPLAVKRNPTARDRLRRTRLYAPGNNPRLLVGIELHNADCVLLDLEDSVPPAEKYAARILVKHLLAALRFPEVWVRINPLDTYGRDDLAEVLRAQPHGVCLPKAEFAASINELDEELTRLEGEYGIPQGSTHIMPIIETAKGLLHCEGVAAANKRVVILAFGAEDFTRDLGAKRTQESLLFARSMIVASAKASEVQASDTVYPNVEDEEGLIAEARLARDLGFDGKGVINPRQIEPIHAVFSPSEQEIEQARRIVAAAEEAETQGIGAIAIGGKMIDRPVLKRAQRTLKLAGLIEKGGAQ